MRLLGGRDHAYRLRCAAAPSLDHPQGNDISYVPVPVKVTPCGLPPPLSLTPTAAVRFPVTVGLNVTVIVHCPPGCLYRNYLSARSLPRQLRSH